MCNGIGAAKVVEEPAVQAFGAKSLLKLLLIHQASPFEIWIICCYCIMFATCPLTGRSFIRSLLLPHRTPDNQSLPPLVKERAGSESPCLLHIFIAEMSKIVCQGNGPLRVWSLDECNGHSRLDHPLPRHPAEPAGTPGLRHTCSQSLDTPAPLDFPARIAWPCDLNLSFANGVDVSNACRRLGQSIHGKILTETSRANLRPVQFRLPDWIMHSGIQEYCLTELAMILRVCLYIALEVRSVEPARLGARHAEERRFPRTLHPVRRTRCNVSLWRTHLYRLEDPNSCYCHPLAPFRCFCCSGSLYTDLSYAKYNF